MHISRIRAVADCGRWHDGSCQTHTSCKSITLMGTLLTIDVATWGLSHHSKTVGIGRQADQKASESIVNPSSDSWCAFLRKNMPWVTCNEYMGATCGSQDQEQQRPQQEIAIMQPQSCVPHCRQAINHSKRSRIGKACKTPYDLTIYASAATLIILHTIVLRESAIWRKSKILHRNRCMRLASISRFKSYSHCNSISTKFCLAGLSITWSSKPRLR